MRNDDDESVFDEHGVMRRDGTFRVPVRIMDGVQRTIAESTNAETARDQYIREIGNAWQTPALQRSTGAQVTRDATLHDAGRAGYLNWLSNAWRTAT